MSEPQEMGNNARERLNSLAKQISDHLNDIADGQEEVKKLKAEAKSEGYDLKALGQIIKEMRKGPDYQAQQLTLELVLDTYREAADLPRTLEQAQSAAAAAAETVPEPKKKRSKAANDDQDEHDRTPAPRKDLN